MKRFFYLFIVQCVVVTNIWGYAFHVHHMHNPILHQRIFLLSDIHLNHRASSRQREAILNVAKLMDALLLTEDQLILYSPVEDYDMYSCDQCLQPILNALFKDPIHFDQNNNYGVDGSGLDMSRFETITPIFLLTHCARSCGVKALSVECRQIEMVSTCGWPISGAVVYKTLLELVRQISEYDDGPFLNNYYLTCLNHFTGYLEKYSEFFRYLENSTLNLEQISRKRPCFQCVKKATIELLEESFMIQYLKKGFSHEKAQSRSHAAAIQSVENSSESIYEQFLCDLLLFLVDTRILHYIAINKNEPTIIVFAGGAHIDEVKQVLERCGYTCLEDTGAQACQPRALNLACYFNSTKIDIYLEPIKLFDDRSSCKMFSIDCNKNFVDMFFSDPPYQLCSKMSSFMDWA